MKRWIFVALLLPVIVLAAGCCGPRGCAEYSPRPTRAYVQHSPRPRALFTEFQHPIIDPNGQYRLMGDAAFRDWQCQPAVELTPAPE